MFTKKIVTDLSAYKALFISKSTNKEYISMTNTISNIKNSLGAHQRAIENSKEGS
ncbi:hypothetical protein Hanom_Chr09g00760201 [Helianthus anomalus]